MINSTAAKHTEEDDESSGDGGGSESFSNFIFPFEARAKESEDGVRSLAPNFWYDGTFAELNWFQSTIQWGKWVYDSNSMQLTHILSKRNFRLQLLDSPDAMLRALTSLLVQPHSEPERFYQLIYGLLKYRHGISIDDFWHNGLATLTASPIKNPAQQPHAL
jgi:hypothetical protein